MRRPGRWRFVTACLLLSALSLFAFSVGLATCLESECAWWQQAVNTATFFAVPTFLVAALIGVLVGRLKRR
jgi:hypothetical protein